MNASALSELEALVAKCRDDFPHFGKAVLRIRTKAGGIDPLTLNKAQRYLDERLGEQKAKTGKVRALILKGRQQGISTYVSGRFYHQAAFRRGVRVFILTHEQEATDNLFGMVARYHEHNCIPPHTGAASAKELYFDKLDSGYKVGTAGTKGVGRSQTIQLFHGSEVAFWPHADTHAAGVLQAVPDETGTEVILESTANGVGNFFHQQWQAAEAGASEYQAIFVPWYWQDEYRKPVDKDFNPSPEEREYQEAYGLTLEQIAWRRVKIAELKDPLLFKQEYPATAAEAFQMTGHDSYIKPENVVKARKATCQESGPLIIGVDPARFGDDRFSVAWRRGRKLRKVESKTKIDTMEGSGWIKRIIDTEKPAKVFIDVGGLGAGVYDRLKEWGGVYEDIVKAVNFGGNPIEPEPPQGGGPRNRRAEMWMKSKEWLEDEAGADIPDSDSLQADACGPSYKYDSNSRVLIESKEDMRRRGVRSPDDWDAVVLTFAEPVREVEAVEVTSFGVGGWMG